MERQHQTDIFSIKGQFLAVFLLLVLFSQTGLAAQVESIAIVSIPDNRSHQKFISTFKAEFLRDYPAVDIAEYPLDEFDSAADESLIVTLGSRAFKEVDEESIPVFHTLISNSLYTEYSPDDNVGKYHLTFNQPLERIFKLYSLALPNFNKIGILVGNSYPEFKTEINKQRKSFW